MEYPHSSLAKKLPVKYGHLGLLVMVVLVFLSAWFYQERAWFLDVAYQTVLMINEGTVQVQVNRFGAAIVQFLPLLAIKLALPLVWVSIMYSLSFTLLYLMFFWVTLKILKEPLMAFAMVLLYTAMVFDGFYWCTSELQQGLGFLLVFWTFLLKYLERNGIGYLIAIVISIIALVFYHPLVFIPFCFCWVFFGLTHNPLFRNKKYYAVLGVLILVLIIKGTYFPNWYDASKMAVFKENLFQYFPSYHNLPAISKFIKNAILYWWGFSMLLGICTLWYSYHRKWLKLSLVWSACIVFVLLNAIGAPNATYRFYSEVNYYPLTIFVAIPFCYDILPHVSGKKIVWYCLLLFFLGRFTAITVNHLPYKERLSWLSGEIENVQSKNEGDRFIREGNTTPVDILMMNWGTPFESLLITSSASPENASTYLVTDQQNLLVDSLINQTDLFLMDFYKIPIEDFNTTYFKFSPNQQYYKVKE